MNTPAGIDNPNDVAMFSANKLGIFGRISSIATGSGVFVEFMLLEILTTLKKR